MKNQYCIDTIQSQGFFLPDTLTWRQWLKVGAEMTRREAKFMLSTLKVWRTRMRQRRELSGLSNSALKDIGISRMDANLEAMKPFWKA